MDVEFERMKLQLQLDEKKGRVLKTQKARREGELIVQDRALALIVLPKYQKSNCQSCLQAPPVLLRCSACKMARYCNSTCQQNDWEIHKGECEIICHSKRIIPTHCMLLIRLLCVNQKKLKISKRVGKFCSEIELLGDQDNLPEDTRETLAQIVLEMTELIETRLDTLPDVAYKVLKKIIGNTFSIINEELIPYAVGVYPLASMFNHSCTPNCVQFFTGNQVYIRSVVDIKPGEELTISYIDLIQEVAKRQKELLNGYYFKCECVRCTSEELSPRFTSNEKQDRIFLEIARKRKAKDWSGILEITKFFTDPKSIMTICDRIKLTEQIMDAHIELQNWKEAINNGESLIQYYHLSTLPKHFPLIALNKAKVAKLLLQIHSLNDAVVLMEGAIKSIKVCYGEKGSVYDNLLEMYGCAQLELKQIQD